MTYQPQGWVLLLLSKSNGRFLYRIFAQWSEGDYWRLSSGSDDLQQLIDADTHWKLPQSSGSLYVLPKNAEGNIAGYSKSVLKQIIQAGKEQGMSIEKVLIHRH